MIFVTVGSGAWHDHVVTVATLGNRDGFLKCAQRRLLGTVVNHRNRPRSAAKFLVIVHGGVDTVQRARDVLETVGSADARTHPGTLRRIESFRLLIIHPQRRRP